MNTCETQRGVAVAIVAILGAAACPAFAIELRQVSRNQNLMGTSVIGYAEPVWASDGLTIVAVGAAPIIDPPYYESNFGLFGMTLDGNFRDWPRSVGGWWLSRPSFDPTQSKVALDSHINLSCVGLAVTETAADALHIDCLRAGQTDNPAWSPDGQTIVVATSSGLEAVSATGSGSVPLTTRAGDNYPAWSRDGTRLAYSSTQGGSRDLWIRDMTTGSERRLTDDVAQDTWPAWSPRGDWIAFASDRGGTFDIWAVPTSGGEPVLIAGRVGDESAPAWSPDGLTIAFESEGQIWVATSLPDQIIAVAPMSWSAVKTLYRGDGR